MLLYFVDPDLSTSLISIIGFLSSLFISEFISFLKKYTSPPPPDQGGSRQGYGWVLFWVVALNFFKYIPPFISLLSHSLTPKWMREEGASSTFISLRPPLSEEGDASRALRARDALLGNEGEERVGPFIFNLWVGLRPAPWRPPLVGRSPAPPQ
uniref:Uncharacterized protein n=1 Tax=Morchella brunnea TaxID=1174671 RepID=A0A8K1MGF3_9PEZI|nr:hypothetical protein LK370_mgp210 [Morchella brunnea]UBU98493.1 hypothetical protein [Morchella brunnea]